MHLIPSIKQITYHPNYKLDSMRYPGLSRGARPGRVFCICRTIKLAEEVKAKYGKAQRTPMPPGAVTDR